MDSSKILKLLKEAKINYEARIASHKDPTGMCYWIYDVLIDCPDLSKRESRILDYKIYTGICDIISKFTPEFCDALNSNEPYWWPIEDYDSRLKAFDKLIKHYEGT